MPNNLPSIYLHDTGWINFEGTPKHFGKLLEAIREIRDTVGTGKITAAGINFRVSCPELHMHLYQDRILKPTIIEEFRTFKGTERFRSDEPTLRRPDTGNDDVYLELRCGYKKGVISAKRARNDLGIKISTVEKRDVILPFAIGFKLYPQLSEEEVKQRHPCLDYAGMAGRCFIGWFNMDQHPPIRLTLVNWWRADVSPDECVEYARLADRRANETIDTILKRRDL
jgi:hypothetical protein